ncbi:DNA-binding LacI/PurR family transcriptional regulator [Actinoplanes tereljensis]|uniref:LacI family transcriptional regulator n=1 Tax=Paractinoplanes tereljensis TaxID=571912 RepID=A0A919NPF1_9ACTN|nr:LacI family DNA-binding transcriptional regulator [Actinoplanes tereljensis]GIF22600.1 LacI family transcriptional regulator [Actinoplanes tereljensis]
MARVTLKDVATASGVSIATVSFVLNDAAGQTIPAATRDRVRRAAAELGYVPHGMARALREGTSRLVLLNTAGLPPGGSLRSFIEGLEDELDQHGHALLVRHGTGRSGSLRRVVEAAAPRAVIDLAGLYAGTGTDVDDGGWIDGLAAHTATQIGHLASRGHHRLALALPDDPRLARLASLREAHTRQIAEALGLAESVVIRVGDDRAAHRDALDSHPGVTAVAAFDDDTALRVLSGTNRTDLAVIGFDETPHGALWKPSLTTVRIDAAGYGRRAARRALGHDAGDAPVQASRVIVRESA